MRKWIPVVTVVAISALVTFGDVSAQQKGAPRLTAEDRLEIQELFARYSQAFDLPEGTAEAWAGTFTADGAMGNNTGRQALLEYWKKRHDDPNRPTTRHWTTHLVVTPTSEGATGTCYFMIVNSTMKPPAITSSGVYDDVLVKTPEGWRFKKRVTRSGAPQAPSTSR